MTTSLPAGYTRCEECRGTGREVETDEVLDEETGEVVAEIPRDYGRCPLCEGRGWFAPETPAQQAAREAQERQASREQRLEKVVNHLASGRCTARDAEGAGCYAPWQFHYYERPGDVRL